MQGSYDSSGDEAGGPSRLWIVHQFRGLDVGCLVGARVEEARLALVYLLILASMLESSRSGTGPELPIVIKIVRLTWGTTSTESSYDAQTQKKLWQASRQTHHLQCLLNVAH